MLEIDTVIAARRTPLDVLAVDFFTNRSGKPSIDFCRQAAGVPDSDEVVARRLSVAISTVRGWRDVGRRVASRWACQ